MSDSDDTNSRRAARPSTPPFRGPAGAGAKPPLTPPGGSTGPSPAATPGKPGAKPGGPAPFALPPAAGRGRPATPAQGARRPTPTPPVDRTAAIPSYGSPPPPSVAATLKSISEFTIVEEPEESKAAQPAGGTAAYEAPTVTEEMGSVTNEPTMWDATTARAAGVVTEATSEADRLFDSPHVAEESVESVEAFDSAEAEANDDVIATAFGGSEPSLSGPHEEEETSEEPTFIGGDPSTRFAAESLEEVARGIRAGEILLPPIDPAAGQPAVLAAVLAAILAPRR